MPELHDDLPPLEGDPAFLLEEGVSYVRAWSTAQHAVSALKSALSEVGRGDAMPYLRADVTEFGSGVVELGPRHARDGRADRSSPQSARTTTQEHAALTSPHTRKTEIMTHTNGSIPYLDITVPHTARVQDYLLGGKANWGADQAAAEQLRANVPHAVEAIRDNRAFLRRAVRYLAIKAGIPQFIAFDCGLPTQGNVHQVAQGINPDARVIYVDADPVVIAHARALLSGQANVVPLLGDLRQLATVVEHPIVQNLIDLDRPVGVSLFGAIDLIDDKDDPYDIAAQLQSVVAPGSYLILSHAAATHPDHKIASLTIGNDEAAGTIPRNHEQVTAFFEGFELIAPGIVDIREWQPDLAHPSSTTFTAFYGGIGRKPLAWSPSSSRTQRNAQAKDAIQGPADHVTGPEVPFLPAGPDLGSFPQISQTER